MLRAIELAGFKSFADKTRFEFPIGITVVVGPNGSGKSNVVDAIKWVLGEQSPKSLRGKEMADVIFNGSGSRRAMNSADVTLTLDNSKSLLAVDSKQVQITRRVYRSGEGEYLINKEPSRLRDIRELFAGTGVATEAYSVIEQGKVDVLLQSSPKDRRLIFEEAAGISRFKAKKVEAARRLERVDQNLLRLSDIVEEVESRLRSVRLQASKARRYREYSTRLKELRIELALVDWRRLMQSLAAIDAELAAYSQEGDGCRAEMQRLEAEALGIEAEVIELDEAIRAGEGRMAAVREQIAAAESLIEGQRTRSHELDEQAARLRRQQSALAARAGDAQDQILEARQAVDTLVEQAASLRKKLSEDDAALSELAAELDRLRAAGERSRAAYAQRMREVAALDQEIGSLDAQRAAAVEALARATQRIEQLTELSANATVEFDAARGEHERSQSEVERLVAAVEQAQTELTQRRQTQTERQASLADLRIRRTATQERAALLAELEEKLEGLSAGVKQALSDARTRGDSIFRDVRGLVADVVDVNVDMAPLVDVALGEMAGHLVVGADRQLFDALAEGQASLTGRVALVRYDLKRPSSWSRPTDYANQPGVVGRADRFVRTAPEYADLVERLLGRTWIVESLHVALTLAQAASHDERFVTLAGELVTADGMIVVGPRLAATGLISRRSELRALREQLSTLDREIATGEKSLSEIAAGVAESETRNKSFADELRLTQQSHAEHRARRQTAEQRRAHYAEQLATVTAERDDAERGRDTAAARLAELRTNRTAVDAAIAQAQAEIDNERTRVESLDADRVAMLRQTTAARVELAKAEQQLEHHRTQLRQFELHREERQKAIDECREQLKECAAKGLESQRTILRTESEVASAYLNKEKVAAEVRGKIDIREGRRTARTELATRTQKLRARLRVIDDSSHERQLAAGEIRHERTVLADRLREDYDLDLAELAARPPALRLAAHADADETERTSNEADGESNIAAATDAELSDAADHAVAPKKEPDFDRNAVENEIADLRRKVNAIGGVNLDALAELEELETRHAALAAQHNDLATAKNSLEQIIERINADSRKLFADTLETVRGHFQQLFRKLFGGGQADIVLEEGVDVLDGGIEIVARPPGKEPRSISLLSGGEKTLTCVALLLAVFRNRPSPFCVLDEVDAALDEANIERFVGVLREFLTITQFIVVTHSKKTMTAASTLYGVTMQESGISKRVSVRFEDVSETGEISQAAIARSASEPVDTADESHPPAAETVITADGESLGDVEVDGDDESSDETQAA
jgi:chromosome segregation protein